MSLAEAINSGDLHAALDHWMPDAVLVSPDGSEVRGSDEIEKRLAALIASGATLQIEANGVIETEQVAMAATRMVMAISGASDHAVEFTATVVYAREPDGWRIAIDTLTAM